MFKCATSGWKFSWVNDITRNFFFLKFSHHFSPLLWGHRYCGTWHMDGETIPLHLKYIYDNEIFKLLLWVWTNDGKANNNNNAPSLSLNRLNFLFCLLQGIDEYLGLGFHNKCVPCGRDGQYAWLLINELLSSTLLLTLFFPLPPPKTNDFISTAPFSPWGERSVQLDDCTGSYTSLWDRNGGSHFGMFHHWSFMLEDLSRPIHLPFRACRVSSVQPSPFSYWAWN